MAETTHEIISRADARLLGRARYFTGKPCKVGHVAERYVFNGWCCECAPKGWAERADPSRPSHEIVSRADARMRGLMYYFTGKPCARGHVTLRITSNYLCRECSRRAWYYASDAYRESPEAAAAREAYEGRVNAQKRALTPRNAARAANERTYIGQKCARGHQLRYTANACCVECSKIPRWRTDDQYDVGRFYDQTT